MRTYKEKNKLVFMSVISVFTVILGIVLAFLGFFIASVGFGLQYDGMSDSAYRESQMILVAGLCIVIEGFYFAFAGLMGAITNGIKDCVAKLYKYSFVMLAFSIANVLIEAFLLKYNWNVLIISLLATIGVISLLYLLGAFLNARKVKTFDEEIL